MSGPGAVRRSTFRLIAAGLVAIAAGSCASPRAASIEALRALAADERPAVPNSPPPAPEPLCEPRRADPAVAGRTLEQVTAALAPLREAPESTPQGPPGEAVLRARERAGRGDLEGAIRGLAEHVQRSPGDLGAWRELARALDASGRRDLANEAWTRLLVAQPLDPEALALGGIDAAAARKPLVAAERLLRLRQLERVGEAPRGDARAAIGQSVALGLSLREIGHLRAAAECLHEAAEASACAEGADALGMRRQAVDLLRIEGECRMAAGDAEGAATAWRSALAGCASEDRVALPRLVWALRAAGRPRAAELAAAESLADPKAPGREGVPLACAQLAGDGLAGWLPATATDATALRARLALGDATALDALLACSSRLELSPALRFVAERSGLSAAVDRACAVVAARPVVAGEVAAALRALPANPSAVRTALAQRRACLLLANFELVGGDAQAAIEVVKAAGDAPDPWLRAAAIQAAGALEDRARLLVAASRSVDSCVEASALAQSFAAVGDRAAADAWAERAIAIDARDPDAWIARARADLAMEVRDTKDQATQAGLAQARLSAERAWEADPARADALRLLLELLPTEGPQRAEVRQAVRADGPRGGALRELDRAEAGRRAQAGQAEPSIEPLRALVLEDPLDAECARALVTASASLGRLAETERWLDALRVRRPAAAAPLESAVTAKARQGRLGDGVQAVREASQAEPESRARRMAWARSLAIAGRDEEAWSVLANGPDPGDAPRVATERAELALRAGREAVAVTLLKSLAADAALCESQRLAALGVALRLPREAEGRRALCASIARPLLTERDIAPAVLAAAMLDGSDDEAASLAAKSARPWTASLTCEGAQMLLDDGLPMRAVALLRAARERAAPAERAGMLRAEAATLAALGDDAAALAQLQAERARTPGPLLLEDEPATEAREINELAGCFLLADRSEAAMRLFERAIAVDPNLGDALNNLVWLRLLAGRIGDDTAALAERALAAHPHEPSTLDTVAWLGYLRGEPVATVVERLRRATAGADPGLEPTDHLGDALWVSGDRTGATEMWRIVQESAAGRGSRALVTEAFERMQRRRWGVRAWDAASFYDARDGAAIRRAQSKLKAVAEGSPPPVAPRPPAPVAPNPAPNAPAPTP